MRGCLWAGGGQGGTGNGSGAAVPPRQPLQKLLFVAKRRSSYLHSQLATTA